MTNFAVGPCFTIYGRVSASAVCIGDAVKHYKPVIEIIS